VAVPSRLSTNRMPSGNAPAAVRTGFSERVAVRVKVAGRPTANVAWFALVIASGFDAVAIPGKTSGIKVVSKTVTTSLAKTRRFTVHHPNSSVTTRSVGDRAPLAQRQVFGSALPWCIAPSRQPPQGVIFRVFP
jgi:hypothetical protein